MLFYRAALPLSRQTLCYVAGVIRRHRTKIGVSLVLHPEFSRGTLAEPYGYRHSG